MLPLVLTGYCTVILQTLGGWLLFGFFFLSVTGGCIVDMQMGMNVRMQISS
jgi:hypothetical protein